MENDEIYSLLSLLCFNLFLVSLILFVSSYFSIWVLEMVISKKIVLGLGIFFGVLSILFRVNLGECLFSRIIDGLADR